VQRRFTKRIPGLHSCSCHTRLTLLGIDSLEARRLKQGRSDRGISGYIPPKSAQVNFLWGKNDIRMAIQQFYTPKNFIPPKQISGYAPGLKADLLHDCKILFQYVDVDPENFVCVIGTDNGTRVHALKKAVLL